MWEISTGNREFPLQLGAGEESQSFQGLELQSGRRDWIAATNFIVSVNFLELAVKTSQESLGLLRGPEPAQCSPDNGWKILLG